MNEAKTFCDYDKRDMSVVIFDIDAPLTVNKVFGGDHVCFEVMTSTF
jgi:hypothetical protein